jgi:hypothetical protein
MTCDSYLPAFQAQNPAISHDRYGWVDCGAFAGAMAAAFDTCGGVALTGAQVRHDTNEPVPDPQSPGLSLAQVHAALAKHGVDLDVRYRMPWADFAKAIDSGHGAMLEVGYAPIAASRFDAGQGFRDTHMILVLPGWIVMDPLASGLGGTYRYHGEAYPEALLRQAAGAMTLSTGTVGQGYVYAALTRDQRGTWTAGVHPRPGTKKGFFRYRLAGNDIVSREVHYTGGFTAHCSPPTKHDWPQLGISRRLVRLTSGGFTGWWIPAQCATEVP